MMVPIPEGWSEHPVYRGGEQVGFFCVLLNEIHCYRLESAKGHWLTRQDLERLTTPLFIQYGHIVTKVRKANTAGHRFVTRLGFVATTDEGDNIHYRAERLNHARL